MSAIGRGGKGEKKKSSPPLPYKVDMTETAAAVYKDLLSKCKAAQELGHSDSAHCTRFRMVQDAIKNIIPNDPHSKAHALRGHLSNFFRMRKGRWRILWIASSDMGRVCILYISETMRKDGDANDPYVLFEKEYDSGQYDELLNAFGVRKQSARK